VGFWPVAVTARLHVQAFVGFETLKTRTNSTRESAVLNSDFETTVDFAEIRLTVQRRESGRSIVALGPPLTATGKWRAPDACG